jgi:hypothetical protein
MLSKTTALRSLVVRETLRVGRTGRTIEAKSGDRALTGEQGSMHVQFVLTQHASGRRTIPVLLRWTIEETTTPPGLLTRSSGIYPMHAAHSAHDQQQPH